MKLQVRVMSNSACTTVKLTGLFIKHEAAYKGDLYLCDVLGSFTTLLTACKMVDLCMSSTTVKLTYLFIEHEQIASQADVSLCDRFPNQESSGQQVLVEDSQRLGHLLLSTLSLLV